MVVVGVVPAKSNGTAVFRGKRDVTKACDSVFLCHARLRAKSISTGSKRKSERGLHEDGNPTDRTSAETTRHPHSHQPMNFIRVDSRLSVVGLFRALRHGTEWPRKGCR